MPRDPNPETREGGHEARPLDNQLQRAYRAAGAFTVPAINVRGLSYDTGRSIFRTAIKLKAGAFILEIARSEIGYTEQRPAE